MDDHQDALFQAACRLHRFTCADIASYAGVRSSVAQSFLERNGEWFEQVKTTSPARTSRWRVRPAQQAALLQLVSRPQDPAPDEDGFDMLRGYIEEADRQRDDPSLRESSLRMAKIHLETIQTGLWDAQVISEAAFKRDQNTCRRLADTFATLWKEFGMRDENPVNPSDAALLRAALFDWTKALPPAPQRSELDAASEAEMNHRPEAIVETANALLRAANYCRVGDPDEVFRPAVLALALRHSLSHSQWHALRDACVKAISSAMSLPQAGSRLAAVTILAVAMDADEVAPSVIPVLLDPTVRSEVPEAERRLTLAALARLALTSAEQSQSNYVSSVCLFMLEAECAVSECPLLLPAALCMGGRTISPLIRRTADFFGPSGLLEPYRAWFDEASLLRSLAVALFLNPSAEAVAGDLVRMIKERYGSGLLQRMCDSPTDAVMFVGVEKRLTLHPGRAVIDTVHTRTRGLILDATHDDEAADELTWLQQITSFDRGVTPGSFAHCLQAGDLSVASGAG
ncbi:hypothetical protein BYI23_C000470 [Burkholderia sp. YI23]|nr:hypothetical protein BYI23_C000470 [Burkholderia sp. YI23]